jgi:hypothetical protein
MKYDYLESNVKFLEYGGKNLLMRKMLILETARDPRQWSKLVAFLVSALSNSASANVLFHPDFVLAIMHAFHKSILNNCGA